MKKSRSYEDPKEGDLLMDVSESNSKQLDGGSKSHKRKKGWVKAVRTIKDSIVSSSSATRKTSDTRGQGHRN